jgi:glycosyltransferase involved in cell wall biosynthesis/putative flippase GtrA
VATDPLLPASAISWPRALRSPDPASPRRDPARLRIAIVTESWRPYVDGVVTRLDNTVRELRAAGHEVVVIAPSIDPGLVGLTQYRTPTLSLGWLYGGRPWAIPGRVVGRALRELDPDVVHVVNPVLMGSLALQYASKRYPTVVSYHTDVSVYASMYHLGWARPALHEMMRRVYRRADVRLATSEVGAAQLSELGIGDVELWGRGVDLELFKPDRDGSAMRRRLCPDPDRKLLVYVGRLAREKGCERLLSLAAEGGPYHVALVGDGPDRAHLEQLFAGTQATFTGVLQGTDLADAYAAADVFVFPSETDTLGLVLLEALASGVPVVATDSPAARVVLGECPSARLVTAGASEAALREAVDAAVRLPRSLDGGAGRRLVRDRGWQAATHGLVEHYRLARLRTKPPRRKRFGKFLAVGASNAVVDLGVFNLFVLVHPTRSAGLNVVYNTVAVIGAIINSYFWNSRWTFSDVIERAGGRWRQRALFLAQGGINLAVSDAVVLGLALALGASRVLPAAVVSNLSKVVAMFTASAVSYLLMHYVVFRVRAPRPHHTGDAA